MSSLRVVLIDNYDSFVYNLYQRIGEITGIEAIVLRNDAIDLEGVRALDPSHILLSPGPGHPADPARIGICGPILEHLSATTPILGICLGHQALALSAGARILRQPPVHGKIHSILHAGEGLFYGLQSPLRATRYHSLAVDPTGLPAALKITAWTEEGLIMGLQHRKRPLFGLQFHPESIGTPEGSALLARFLGLKGPQASALASASARAIQ